VADPTAIKAVARLRKLAQVQRKRAGGTGVSEGLGCMGQEPSSTPFRLVFDGPAATTFIRHPRTSAYTDEGRGVRRQVVDFRLPRCIVEIPMRPLSSPTAVAVVTCPCTSPCLRAGLSCRVRPERTSACHADLICAELPAACAAARVVVPCATASCAPPDGARVQRCLGICPLHWSALRVVTGSLLTVTTR
jgi:hypothetical protein